MKSLNGIIRKDLRVESITRAIALAEQDFVAAKDDRDLDLPMLLQAGWGVTGWC